MTDADFITQTLYHARATARTYRDPDLADDCAKAIERVAVLAQRANGWASKYPRGKNDKDKRARTSTVDADRTG